MNYWSNQGKKHIGFITKEAWEDPPEEFVFLLRSRKSRWKT